MATSNLVPPESSGNFQPTSLRAAFAEAIRFWEPRRILYNLLLVAVTLLWVAFTWPHFRPAFQLPAILALGILALLANICYCAAYLVEAAMLGATFRNIWKNRQRWALWVVGTLFAILLANYWIADEIYPDFR
jgi:threonine/homoserine/homoserine lactone efflux protein